MNNAHYCSCIILAKGGFYSLRINKKNQCKEFYSYFHFVGQVKRHVKGAGDNAEIKPIYETTTTKTGKPRRVLQFDVLTNKYNKLKVELGGMEFESVTLYSSNAKKSYRIPWRDRHDKSKYPDPTYTIIGGTDWDNCELYGSLLAEGMWVEVKGKYEFGSYTNDEGKRYLTVKRKPTSIAAVADGQEITLRTKEKINYVCDFDNELFQEINNFNLEIGIKSVYQDDSRNTKVNGVFLANGKDRSVPQDVELMVYYKEPQPGKQSLADAFTKLNRLDFVEVRGVDNNRPEFAEVTEVTVIDDDPFAEVDEKEANTRKVISGNRKGLEVLSVVAGTAVKSLLTEEEIAEEQIGGFYDDDDFFKDEQPF